MQLGINPTKDDTHYHLIYATRNDRGLEVFKTAETAGMEKQEEIRNRLQASATDQLDLFDLEAISPLQTYYKTLRDNYLERMKTKIHAMIASKDILDYDELWAATLSEPMTWRTDLNGFLNAMKDSGAVEFLGLSPKERTLKRNASHRVRLIRG